MAESAGGREIAVYLPSSYAAGEAKYPVVYVQDGSYLFESSIEELEWKIERGELRELIFIGIGPVNRTDEYTPWFAPALSDKFADFGGRGAEYLSFVTGELKPWIDARYRTSRRAEETGIAGASLGGLISLYAAYRYPGVFGRIGLLSASFWYPGMLGYMRTEPIAAASRKIYMYVGSAEGIDKRNIQSTMVPYTKEAFALLTDGGFSGDRLRLEIEEGAGHKAAYFIKRFPEAMAWLFPAETGP